jgi:hypothetical protein
VVSPHGRVNWTLLDGTEVSETEQKSGKSTVIKVTKPIYECRCDERLKLKMRNLHTSYTLGCHTLGCSGNWKVCALGTHVLGLLFIAITLLFIMNR